MSRPTAHPGADDASFEVLELALARELAGDEDEAEVVSARPVGACRQVRMEL